MPDTQEATAITVKEIPTDLWRRLKIRAAIDGSTIQATVAKAIEHYLRSAA